MNHQNASHRGCALSDVWNALPSPPTKPPQEIINPLPPNTVYAGQRPQYTQYRDPNQSRYQEDSDDEDDYDRHFYGQLRHLYQSQQAQTMMLQQTLANLMRRQRKQWKVIWELLSKKSDSATDKGSNDGTGKKSKYTTLWCVISGLIVAVFFLFILVIICFIRKGAGGREHGVERRGQRGKMTRRRF